MSLNLERVYSDTGADLTTPLLSTAIVNANEFLYDGRFMWVACDSGIAIYELWGESTNNEPPWDELDLLLYPRYDEVRGREKKLKLTTFIKITASQILRSTRHPSLSLRPEIIDTTPAGSTTVGSATVTLTKFGDFKVITEVSPNPSGTALTPKHLAKVGSKIYCVGSNFQHIFEFDITTQRGTEVINLPMRTDVIRQIGNSNLVSAGGKLWFVNTFFDDATPQRLYRHTPGDSTMTHTNIPNRPSLTKQFLADGKNGHVYLANFNDVSVGKYRTSDGAYIANIRTNAFPTGIWSDENRRIFVNSFAGMLTLVDWDDDGVHNDWSTDDAALSLVTDTKSIDHVWWVDGTKVVRHNLNTKQQVETYVSGTQQDWMFKTDKPLTPNKCMTMTLPTTIGTVTVGPYVFVGGASSISAFRLDDRWLYRPSFSEVNGQGAVVAGNEEYFGEE